MALASEFFVRGFEVPRVLTDEDVSDFRERLCDAAERLFAEHGADAVSMRQLASELGVSPMTPYRYFKDKDDILAAVRTSGFDRFAEALEAALASSQDTIERTRAVGEAYVHFAFAHPAAYRLMFDLSQPNEDAYPDLTRAAERARRTMSDYVDTLIAAGIVEGESQTVSHIFWAATHGLVVLKLAGKLDPALDFDTLWQATFAALVRGLRARTAPRS
jgi:AcrR family transcriptional regulator